MNFSKIEQLNIPIYTKKLIFYSTINNLKKNERYENFLFVALGGNFNMLKIIIY